MQVKATWTNGLVHNILHTLIKKGYLKECGTEQIGKQYARKLCPVFDREEYIAKLMIQKADGKSSIQKVMVALARENKNTEQSITELEEIVQKLREEK